MLSDSHHVKFKADIGLVGRAVRQRWPVKADNRPIIVKRLLDTMTIEEVEVQTKWRKLMLEGPADAHAIAAASVIVEMSRQNAIADHAAIAAIRRMSADRPSAPLSQ